jgi:hypothetical protein
MSICTGKQHRERTARLEQAPICIPGYLSIITVPDALIQKARRDTIPHGAGKPMCGQRWRQHRDHNHGQPLFAWLPLALASACVMYRPALVLP